MSFSLTIPMVYLAFWYFCNLTLVLKPREVINPFIDISNFSCTYESWSQWFFQAPSEALGSAGPVYPSPRQYLVEQQPSHNPELLYDQKDTPKDPSLPHECNYARKRTQHQVIIHGKIIHSYFHPLPPQASIALPNQNQTLKLGPLWEIRVSLVDGLLGLMYLDMHHAVAPSPGQNCGFSISVFPTLWYINLCKNT